LRKDEEQWSICGRKTSASAGRPVDVLTSCNCTQ
jgi:hypothetical protein